MNYIILKNKYQFIIEAYNNENIYDINKGLIKEYGKDNVNFFALVDYFDADLFHYYKLLQFVKGENKYYIETDGGLLYLKLMYPEFYSLFEKNYEVPTNLKDEIESLLKMNTKTIDIVHYSLHYNVSELITLSEIDPTKEKKYFKWLCRTMLTKLDKINEDFVKLQQLLSDFHKPKVKNEIKKLGYSTDIMTFENDNDLFDVVSSIISSNNFISKSEAYKECLKLEFTDEWGNEWGVFEVKNYEQSKILGTGTYWCTAADSPNAVDAFYDYTDNSLIPLLIVINITTREKFQLAYLTGDFLDQSDEEFNLFKIPGQAFKFILDYINVIQHYKFNHQYAEELRKFYQQNHNTHLHKKYKMKMLDDWNESIELYDRETNEKCGKVTLPLNRFSGNFKMSENSKITGGKLIHLENVTIENSSLNLNDKSEIKLYESTIKDSVFVYHNRNEYSIDGKNIHFSNFEINAPVIIFNSSNIHLSHLAINDHFVIMNYKNLFLNSVNLVLLRGVTFFEFINQENIIIKDSVCVNKPLASNLLIVDDEILSENLTENGFINIVQSNQYG